MPVETQIVTADEGGIRLDRWFKRRYPAVSHGLLEKWLRTGQVRVDGARVKSGQRLEEGQSVRVPPLPDQPPPPPTPKPVTLSPATLAWLKEAILFIDDDILVLNKPPGLAVQGGTGLGEAHLDAMLDVLAFDAPERPRLVHRLDKDTSGVLVLGRNAFATAALAQAFKVRTARKCYWALVAGVPKIRMGTIDAALAKRPGRLGDKVEVDEDDGKRAVTAYRVVDHAGRHVAWLEMEPKTGRTHQLRAHCVVLGTPIIGDGKYGGRAAFLDGLNLDKSLHLHARAVRLPHPRGGVIEVVAPLPPHFLTAFQSLNFNEKDAGKPFVAFEE